MFVSGIPEPMNLLRQNWACCLLAGSGLPQNHKRTFLVHPRTGHSKMCISGIPETDISGTILELMYSRNVVYWPILAYHKRTFLVHARTGHLKMSVSGIPETDISGTIPEVRLKVDMIPWIYIVVVYIMFIQSFISIDSNVRRRGTVDLLNVRVNNHR